MKLMQTKHIVIILIVLNLILIGLLVFPKLKRSNKVGPPMREIAERLSFNSNQKDQLKEAMESHRVKADEVLKEIRFYQNQLFSNLDADSATVETVSSKLGRLKTKLEYITFEHMKEIESICDEEQKKMFRNLMHDLLRRKGQGQHPPPRHRPPPPQR